MKQKVNNINNTTTYFGNEPIDMSYITKDVSKQICFEMTMKYPYRFFEFLNEDDYEKYCNDPNEFIHNYITDEKILKYCDKAIESFSIKTIN